MRILQVSPWIKGCSKFPSPKSFVFIIRHACTHTHTLQAQSPKQSAVCVRFAPSPTGYLHLGGLRTALFNYLFARKSGGKFLLRIEDTDRTRYVRGAVENLVKTLQWAGLTYDEGPGKGEHGPYRQSERIDIYRMHINRLLSENKVYRCFCTHERLQQVRLESQKSGREKVYDRHCLHLTAKEIDENISQGLPYTIRLKVVKDLVHGPVKFSGKTVDDAILLKSDGYPTYHLANVIDDHLMCITHVIRGEEWLPSTPKHLLLYQAFGWDPPYFAHVPLLFNPDRTKLSKRSGDVTVEDFARNGYLPEAVLNFVALLGWYPPSANEVMTLDDMVRERYAILLLPRIDKIATISFSRNDTRYAVDTYTDAVNLQCFKFSLEHLNKSPAIVMHEKLDFLNKQHLLRKAETPAGLDELVAMLGIMVRQKYESRQVDEQLSGSEGEYRLGNEYLAKVLNTIKERIRNVNDIPRLCEYFFVDPDYDTKSAKRFRSKIADETLRTAAVNALEKLNLIRGDNFTLDNLKTAIDSIIEDTKLDPKDVKSALRYIITGTQVGAHIAETIHTLGDDICIRRLQKVLDAIKE
ncbi:8369_t:CDS:10 [Paraglomus occultum]|uniref:Glutamate--tRNA ligase, mitochondrial n=1 Tax=Paraglomus occultum TaxID=144539 RepID=A0A9N9AJV0_9GLOM|nr:8369_t:CDS:10 [Paraglomus occultum]